MVAANLKPRLDEYVIPSGRLSANDALEELALVPREPLRDHEN